MKMWFRNNPFLDSNRTKVIPETGRRKAGGGDGRDGVGSVKRVRYLTWYGVREGQKKDEVVKLVEAQLELPIAKGRRMQEP